MIGGSFRGCIRLTPIEMFFRGFLRKVTFFEKIVVQKNIRIRVTRKKKGYIRFCHQMRPSLGRGLGPLGHSFSLFSRKIGFFCKNGWQTATKKR